MFFYFPVGILNWGSEEQQPNTQQRRTPTSSFILNKPSICPLHHSFIRAKTLTFGPRGHRPKPHAAAAAILLNNNTIMRLQMNSLASKEVYLEWGGKNPKVSLDLTPKSQS